ncbi:MAG: glycerol-3-phosphate acyltransferase [Lachnospiraceae bacterium]|nr:glycerol-3-phosphate acyltransferase [Lachnospiraceae bacterium]
MDYRILYYILFGYLSGSVLYAPFFGRVIAHKDIAEGSRDQNPGTANAFLQGGTLCGFCTLFFELAKGFLPVFLFLKAYPAPGLWVALVMAAPVVGHILPLFHRFQGGKAVAVSFGALLGLYPYLTPVMTLASLFILFSVVIVISPNYHRTFVTYMALAVVSVITVRNSFIRFGVQLICGCILVKLLTSEERREKGSVRIIGFSK